MKLPIGTAVVLFLMTMTTSTFGADAPKVVDVWPGKPPGIVTTEPETVQPPKAGDSKHPVKRVTNVSHPTLSIYPAPADKNTGAAVIIAPGGGYSILAWDLEGEEVASWLNSIGVTGIVLKYRVPRIPNEPKGKPPIGPLQDAQRAVSLVRTNATEWKIDPKRIGFLGFSAGGHLTVAVSNEYDNRAYEPLDDIDKTSCRPDFAIPVYPAYLTNASKDGFSPDFHVTSKTPPSFIVQANDDHVGPENSVYYYLALKKSGVPAELHIYATGGHGFGLRKTESASSNWPERCVDWMKVQGIIK